MQHIAGNIGLDQRTFPILPQTDWTRNHFEVKLSVSQQGQLSRPSRGGQLMKTRKWVTEANRRRGEGSGLHTAHVTECSQLLGTSVRFLGFSASSETVH